MYASRIIISSSRIIILICTPRLKKRIKLNELKDHKHLDILGYPYYSIYIKSPIKLHNIFDRLTRASHYP